MEVSVEKVSHTITLRDNSSTELIFINKNVKTNDVFLLLPAMGVRASYYLAFTERLAINLSSVVVIMDLRGQGKSSIWASRKINFGYEDIILDVEEVIAYVKKIKPSFKIHILGHSLGGQIGCLYASRFSDQVEHLYLIATCLPYYKLWQGLSKTKVFIAGKLFYPLSLLFGYFPGQLIGFGGNEPRTLMKEWCHTVLHGLYKIKNTHINYETTLAQYTGKVTSISYGNDKMAPEPAVNALMLKMLNAKLEGHHIQNENHFSWTKNTDETLSILHP